MLGVILLLELDTGLGKTTAIEFGEPLQLYHFAINAIGEHGIEGNRAIILPKHDGWNSKTVFTAYSESRTTWRGGYNTFRCSVWTTGPYRKRKTPY